MAKHYSGINEMTANYAKARGITKKEAEERVRDIIEIMKETLLNDNRDGIQLIDFLTLKKVVRKSKVGRNPKNPEHEVIIPPRIGIKAELGKAFDREING